MVLLDPHWKWIWMVLSIFKRNWLIDFTKNNEFIKFQNRTNWKLTDFFLLILKRSVKNSIEKSIKKSVLAPTNFFPNHCTYVKKKGNFLIGCCDLIRKNYVSKAFFDWRIKIIKFWWSILQQRILQLVQSKAIPPNPPPLRFPLVETFWRENENLR